MTGNDVTRPHVTGSDVISPEVTWSGCRRPKIRVLCAFELLQGFNSQVAVKCQEMTSRDLTLPEVSGSDVISPKITWKWLWKAENSGFVYFRAPTGP